MGELPEGALEQQMSTQDEHLKKIVNDAIAAVITEQRKSFDPGRYITFTQAVLGIIGSLMVFTGLAFNYMAGVQSKIDANSQRDGKLEYQAQISIDDRHDIHSRLDHFEATTSEINQRLARIDTKLDEIKARQGVR